MQGPKKQNKQKKLRLPTFPPRALGVPASEMWRGRACATPRRRRPNGRSQQTQPHKTQTTTRPPHTKTQGRDKHAHTKHKGTKIARRNFLDRAFRRHEAGQPRPPTMSLRKKSPPRPFIYFFFFFHLVKDKRKKRKKSRAHGRPQHKVGPSLQ